MSMATNKQTLRDVAEKAKELGDISRYTKAAVARLEFKEAVTPDVVLALLDELEELEKKHCGRALLEREEHHVKTVNRLFSELESAERRNAELEAMVVTLPKPHAHLIWIQAGYAPDDYWDDVAISHSEKDKCCDGSDRYPVYAQWEIEEALSAAGISIAAATDKGGENNERNKK